jgi:hypothetical protein
MKQELSMRNIEALPGTTIFQIALMRDLVRSVGQVEKIEEVQPLVAELHGQLDVLRPR